MVNINIIMESLSPIERALLPNLSEKPLSAEELAKETEAESVTILRALEFLKNKKLVETKEKEQKQIDLDVNGIHYKKTHLPERRLLNALKEKRFIPFSEIKKAGNLSDDESKIALGVLKKKALINISEGRVVLNAAAQDISKKMLEELFLEKLPITIEKLKPEDTLSLQNLKSRKKIIKIEDKKIIFAKLTPLGKRISLADLNMKSWPPMDKKSSLYIIQGAKQPLVVLSL